MASHTSGVEIRCDNHSGMSASLRVEELLDHLLNDGNSGTTFANHTIMIIDPPLTTKTADCQTPQARQQTKSDHQTWYPTPRIPYVRRTTARHRTTRPRTRHWLVRGSNERSMPGKFGSWASAPQSGQSHLALQSSRRVASPAHRGLTLDTLPFKRPRPDSRHTPVQETPPCARRLQKEDWDVPRLDSGRPHARRTRQARDPLQAHFSEPVQRNKFRLCTAVRNCGLLPRHPRGGNHRV